MRCVCALCVGGAEDGRKLANNKALASGWFREGDELVRRRWKCRELGVSKDF